MAVMLLGQVTLYADETGAEEVAGDAMILESNREEDPADSVDTQSDTEMTVPQESVSEDESVAETQTQQTETKETAPAAAPHWVKDNASGKYRYVIENGSYAKGWKNIDGSWYWFDSNGFRCSGWIKISGIWYYLESNGVRAAGWKKLNNKWYYLKPDTGAMAEGWIKVSGKWYYLYPGSGYMAEGWIKLGGFWYYLAYGSGIMVSNGWHTISGKKYCFDENGRWNQNAELNTLTSVIDSATSKAGWYTSVYKGSLSDNTVKKLNDDMLSLWNSGADVGYLLLDINTKAVICGNPNKYFYSASTLKGPYVCAIGVHASGKASSYSNEIEQTIAASNNDTYASLRRTIGSGVMSDYMYEAGVSGVSSSDLYTDERVKDLSKLWVRNYEYFQLGESNANWIKPYFLHTKYSFIDYAISHTVYSKAGWHWGPGEHYTVYNDGGIVMKAGAPYILVVLSHGSQGTDDAKLMKLVRDLEAAHNELTGAGWKKNNGNWYYYGTNGRKMTGWQFVNGAWYYMNSNGIMQTGWLKWNGKWYYLNSNGVMATGWMKWNGKWYFLNSSGVMQTGWVKPWGTWYYLKSSGAMAEKEWVPGYYWVGSSGAWNYQAIGKWKKDSYGWWFGDSYGWYAKNETITIDGVQYTFDKKGYWIP